MMKGTSKRNNAWHKRHIKKVAQARVSHAARVLSRKNGGVERSQAEKNFTMAQAREKTTHVSFFKRIKFFWLMARIRSKARVRRLFGNRQVT